MVARVKTLLWGLFFAGAASLALADTFNLFSPANGILKGNSGTFVTSPAINTDITTLWASCSSPGTQFLRADGVCATPPGTGGGTVNSVNLAVPSWLSITGCPITSSGTCTIASATGLTNGQVLGVSGGTLAPLSITAAMLPLINLTSGVTGTLPAGSGGSGVASPTAHNVLLSEGSGPFVPLAMAADTLLVGQGSSADPVAAAVPTCAADGVHTLTYPSPNTFSCTAIVAGSGTLTSVSLNMPSVFSITGSPVTGSSGGFTVNFAGAQTADQALLTPCGSSGALSLRALCATDIAGLGVTWTQPQTYSAATTFNAAAVFSTTAAVGSPAALGGLVLRPPGANSFSWIDNPTGSGSGAVIAFGSGGAPGSGTTFGFFDNGGALHLNASASGDTLTTTGSASFTGGVQVGAPTGGNCGTGCINMQSAKINGVALPAVSTGTAVLGLSGCTVTTNVTATFYKVGNLTTLYIPQFSCTSNSNSHNFQNVPTSLQTATLLTSVPLPCGAFTTLCSSGAPNQLELSTSSAANFFFHINGVIAAFPSSGTFANSSPFSITYIAQ